jgi:hypothetical protein
VRHRVNVYVADAAVGSLPMKMMQGEDVSALVPADY